MAEALQTRGEISDVAVTGNGYLTITVTEDALAGLAVRIAEAGPGSARSDTLRGTTVPAPPAADLTAAPSWAEAKKLVTAQVTARLAEAAGATVGVHDHPERGGADVPSPRDVPRNRTGLVADAVAFAGADAIVYALARTPPERASAPDPAAWARQSRRIPPMLFVTRTPVPPRPCAGPPPSA